MRSGRAMNKNNGLGLLGASKLRSRLEQIDGTSRKDMNQRRRIAAYRLLAMEAIVAYEISTMRQTTAKRRGLA